MPLGASRGGVISDSVYRATSLENVNVHTKEGPQSYSQQGPFTSAARVNDTTITTNGPRGAGQLTKRQWNLIKRLVIIASNGQSNSQGVTANAVAIPAIILQPPIPDVYFAVPGGPSPLQAGILTSASGVFIDNQSYMGPLVPARENINTYRTPGDEFNLQTWMTAAGQEIAAALSDGNLLVTIALGVGATPFAEDVQGVVPYVSATWADGVATVEFAAFMGAIPGDTIAIARPGGWPASLLVDTSDGTTITAIVPADPGPFPSDAAFLAMAAPMVNIRTIVRYLNDTVAPALGLTTYFAGLFYNGNEANDDYRGNFTTDMYDVLRGYVEQVAGYCGNSPSEKPYIVWPQVGYNVTTWSTAPTTLFNCASNVSLGPVAAVADPLRYGITYPQYSSEHGAPATVNNLHYQTQGHSDNGARGAQLFLDAVIGDADPAPVKLLYGENVLTRVANSTTITGVYNREAVIDVDREVVDPGNYGFQVASGAAGVTDQEYLLNGINGLTENIIDTVSVNGTALTIELSQLPANAWGNRLSYADAVGNVYTMPKSTQIISLAFDSGTSRATYEFIEPHGIGVGDTVDIVRCIPTGYALLGGTALAGTAGTTLVMALGADPGTLAISAATWTALGGGRATLTFGVPQTASLIVKGNWITLEGFTAAGWNGTWQIFSVAASLGIATGIVVDMASNPGAVSVLGTINGFGQHAVNGQFDLGNEMGPRGTVRGSVIDHFDNSTGYPLPRWAVRQRVPIDVYSSSKSIATMLSEVGLDEFFQLVLDFGDASCYGGTGNLCTNLATTGNDTNYYRGLSNIDVTKTPTFNGTPGALDRTAYFSAATSGKIFTPSNTATITASISGTTLNVTAHSGANIAIGQTVFGTAVATGTTITGLGTGVGGTGTYTVSISQTITSTSMTTGSALMATSHLPGGAGTVIALIRMPSPLVATTTYMLANARTTGSGQGAGFAFRVTPLSGNYVSTLLIRGNAGASIFSTTLSDVPLIAGNYMLVATSWQDGDGFSWIINMSDTATVQYTTFSCAFNAVSTVAPQTPPTIWRNGTGTVEAAAGCEIMALLASDAKLSMEEALPLLRSLYRRQIENLP